MFSRRHVVPGYEPYRFSATRTLSDFPLLIGELLRRGELRAQRQARRRSLIQKFRAVFRNCVRDCEVKGSIDPPPLRKRLVPTDFSGNYKKALIDVAVPASADPRQKYEATRRPRTPQMSNATLFANAGCFRKIKCKHGNAMCKWQRKLVRGTSWRARAWGQHVSLQKHPLKTWIRLLSADGECRLCDRRLPR
jgi:hypothetical protein